MRDKRKAAPSQPQAYFKPYRSATPSNPEVLFLWAQQRCFYSSLRLNVAREVAAYLTPLYILGEYKSRLFTVNIHTCETYFVPMRLTKKNYASKGWFQDKNRAIFSSQGSLYLLTLPSLALTTLPPCSTFGSFLYIRFHAKCLYAYRLETMANSLIEKLSFEAGEWTPPIDALDFVEQATGEVVYKGWWVFFFPDFLEWFSFQSESFGQPTQWDLPRFSLMGEGAEGQVVLIGENCFVYKADIAHQTVEVLQGPTRPWIFPRSQGSSLVSREAIYWLENSSFQLKSIHLTTRIKSKTHLSE